MDPVEGADGDHGFSDGRTDRAKNRLHGLRLGCKITFAGDPHGIIGDASQDAYVCGRLTPILPIMSGNKITMAGGRFAGAFGSHHSLYRRRRHGPRTSGARPCAYSAQPWRNLSGGKKKDCLERSPGRRKAFNQTGNWLPDETLAAFRNTWVGIKGPVDHPVGGGIVRSTWRFARSLTFTCASALFAGSKASVTRQNPGAVDMVIFRENTGTSTRASNSLPVHRKRKKCSTSWRKNSRKSSTRSASERRKRRGISAHGRFE